MKARFSCVWRIGVIMVGYMIQGFFVMMGLINFIKILIDFGNVELTGF